MRGLALLAVLLLACRFDTAGFVPLVDEPDPDLVVEPLSDGVPAEARRDGPGRDGPHQPTPDLPVDNDKDGTPDALDNCPKLANPGQADLDGDKLGDLCDPDRDGDQVPNDIDFRPDGKDTVYHWLYPGTSATSLLSADNWSSNGNLFCSAKDSVHRSAQLDPSLVAQKDYRVETKLRIDSYANGAGWPGVGLALRGGLTPVVREYLCLVDPESKSLVLGIYTGSWSTLGSQGNPGLTVNTSLQLQATVKGGALTCKELTTGAAVNATNTALSSGPPGFFSVYAAACFESLVVTQAP